MRKTSHNQNSVTRLEKQDTKSVHVKWTQRIDLKKTKVCRNSKQYFTFEKSVSNVNVPIGMKILETE